MSQIPVILFICEVPTVDLKVNRINMNTSGINKWTLSMLADGADWGAYGLVIGWVCDCVNHSAAWEVT